MESIKPGYARVTEILSAFNDFSQVPKIALENAQKRGSMVHDLCELYALDLLIEPIPENCKGYFQSFKDWFDSTVEEVINTEERIYHEELYFCGKYDLLCRLKDDEKITLVDYKATFSTHKSWQLQSAAYQLLLINDRNISVGRRITLQLNKEGNTPKAIEYTSHKKDQQYFLKALELYRFFNS